jgi:beta-glucosidase
VSGELLPSMRRRVLAAQMLLILICWEGAGAQTGAMARGSSRGGDSSIEEKPAYQNASLLTADRVKDLLARMTTEEKIGQLLIPEGWKLYRRSGGTAELSPSVSDVILGQKAGTIYGVFRADPWTQVTLATGLGPVQSAGIANALQKFAIEKSRLHIPLLLAEECPHGHMAISGTVFPTGLGQGSTFDPRLIEQMSQAIAAETRATGGNVCYGPEVDVMRDLRWSRVEEGYGEDPFLASSMTSAAVRGLQGSSLANATSVVATMEHLAAGGDPEGGHNLGPIHVGARELNEVFLPPFKAGVDAGARSMVVSYNSIDGVPNIANRWLMTDLLRTQWGFQGLVASDLGGIQRLVKPDRVVANLAQASALALKAGLDADLGAEAFPHLAEALQNGSVSEQDLDRAAGRILAAKFDLGLFDKPYVDVENAKRVVGSPAHRALAREVARESIILMKNSDHTLPLSKDLTSIAVIGPNADSVYNQLGDYTAPQADGQSITVLRGIRDALGQHATVRYARGCGIRDMSTAGFQEALDAVGQSQVAVVVLGGSSARNFSTAFDATGAAKPSLSADGSEMESGEGTDRATLDMAGVQEELLKKIVAVGKPVVLVTIEGRPLTINWAADHVPAILEAFYPGEEGGRAIADVLFGAYNPAGRLPVSMPRAVGQLPVFYGTERPDYVDLPAAPLFPFGYGMSYTTFSYDHLFVTADQMGTGADVSVAITNTGKMSGDEVVQLYLHEQVATVERPAKLLKGFARLHLDAGAKQTVHFHLGPADLAVFNQDSKWMVEAGTFDVLVGGSSSDIRQKGQFSISRTRLLDR